MNECGVICHESLCLTEILLFKYYSTFFFCLNEILLCIELCIINQYAENFESKQG